MLQSVLGRQIYDVSHITGEFLLRSGATSNVYFDKYLFESRPELLSEIAEQFLKILPSGFDLLAGLEMGGIPIATILSLRTGKPAVFVRKQAKKYGTCKLAEGADIKGKKLLIVEDVVTSGGQIVTSTNELREQGAVIEDAICVIDREAGGARALADNGITLLPLFTISDMKKFR